MLGLPTITTTQSLFGGNNFAFAGARLVGGGLPTLIQQAVANRQLGNILAPGVLPNFAPITSFDPNALYVVVGGGNDMRDARTAFGSNSLTDQTGRQAAAVAAVTSLTQTVGYLASHGAKNVLISNIPDLGYTPEAVLLGLQAASSDATSRFNALLPSIFGLETLIPGLNIELLDMAGVSATVRNNPGAYGIANTFLPCDGFTGSDALVGFGIGPFACNVSSFSDALHPSARSHQLIAEAAFHLVPEPTSLALFGLAFAGLVWAQRRKVAVRAV